MQANIDREQIKLPHLRFPAVYQKLHNYSHQQDNYQGLFIYLLKVQPHSMIIHCAQYKLSLPIPPYA
jgi:hypothetical protein